MSHQMRTWFVRNVGQLSLKKVRHIDVVHFKKKMHKCETCPHESCNKGHIKVQNFLIHGKLREHVCEECGGAFHSRKKKTKKQIAAANQHKII